MNKVLKNKDVWGSALSMLCAIHCALIPVLLTLGCLKTVSWLDSLFIEGTVVVLASIFIYTCMLKPYLQKKQSGTSLWVSATGLGLVILHFFPIPYAHFIVILGGIMIASGHIINIRQNNIIN